MVQISPDVSRLRAGLGSAVRDADQQRERELRDELAKAVERARLRRSLAHIVASAPALTAEDQDALRSLLPPVLLGRHR